MIHLQDSKEFLNTGLPLVYSVIRSDDLASIDSFSHLANNINVTNSKDEIQDLSNLYKLSRPDQPVQSLHMLQSSTTSTFHSNHLPSPHIHLRLPQLHACSPHIRPRKSFLKPIASIHRTALAKKGIWRKNKTPHPAVGREPPKDPRTPR